MVLDAMAKMMEQYTHPEAWRCVGGGSWSKPSNTRKAAYASSARWMWAASAASAARCTWAAYAASSASARAAMAGDHKNRGQSALEWIY